jgi:hypothetical protein
MRSVEPPGNCKWLARCRNKNIRVFNQSAVGALADGFCHNFRGLWNGRRPITLVAQSATQGAITNHHAKKVRAPLWRTLLNQVKMKIEM